MIFLITSLIKGYQFFSSFSTPKCRFYPTCSTYMIQSLEKKGLIKGSALGIIRICKCHPFHEGGYDPVK
ncbi:MAG: membrane protein insertion efficiency factor YidD [Candidatus Sericytochromatia bacterium]